MLGFFKVNDPYRLLIILILLVTIRSFFFGFGVPIITLEIKWLTLAEKLANGGVMYQNVWDNTPPLASFVYYVLFLMFGKTTIPFRVISILLVIYQAAIFNNMLLKNKAYNQNTYVPALVYMLFMNLSFDFFTLSPVLMAMTFILLATNNLFKRMDNQTKDEMFVQIGVYLGVATLLFIPSFLYFLVAIISLLIYTGSIFRRMLLLVYGYCLVIILAGIYYYWNDGFAYFRIQFLESIFRLNTRYYITLNELIILSAIPAFIFVLSFYKTSRLGRYINFQIKIQRVMLFFFLSGILALMMVKDFTTFQLIYFIPPLAFFVAHYVLVIRNWLAAEFTFMLLLLLVILNNLIPVKEYFHLNNLASYKNLIVKESPYDNLTRGKKVLVLGSSLDHYSESKLATPYLTWQYASYHLSNPDFYDKLSEVYNNFIHDLPEVIVDEMDVMPALFEKMPTIEKFYEKRGSGIYLLKS